MDAELIAKKLTEKQRRELLQLKDSGWGLAMFSGVADNLCVKGLVLKKVQYGSKRITLTALGVEVRALLLAKAEGV